MEAKLHIGQRITEIRKALGFSQNELSRKLQFNQGNFSKLESGAVKPSYEFLERLLDTFPEINVNYLMLGEGDALKVDTDKFKLASNRELIRILEEQLKVKDEQIRLLIENRKEGS